MNCTQHESFSAELRKLRKTIRTIDKDIEKVKRLLEAHFYDQEKRGRIINPGKLHRIKSSQDNSGREIWKVEVLSPGLRPNQWPRIWFMVDGDSIIFLAINTHINNYSNNRIDKIALHRCYEILDS